MPLLHKSYPDIRIQYLYCFQYSDTLTEELETRKVIRCIFYIAATDWKRCQSKKTDWIDVEMCVWVFEYKTVLKESYNKGEVDKITTSKGSREVV